MNNLDEIKKHYGNSQPFKVPENYFEQFSAKMMEGLPEKEKEKEARETPVISMWGRVKPVFYIAAMFAMAVWSINLLTGDRGRSSSSSQTSVRAAEREGDAVSMKLAMSVDEYSLYEYLSEDQY